MQYLPYKVYMIHDSIYLTICNMCYVDQMYIHYRIFSVHTSCIHNTYIHNTYTYLIIREVYIRDAHQRYILYTLYRAAHVIYLAYI